MIPLSRSWKLGFCIKSDEYVGRLRSLVQVSFVCLFVMHQRVGRCGW